MIWIPNRFILFNCARISYRFRFIHMDRWTHWLSEKTATAAATTTMTTRRAHYKCSVWCSVHHTYMFVVPVFVNIWMWTNAFFLAHLCECVRFVKMDEIFQCLIEKWEYKSTHRERENRCSQRCPFTENDLNGYSTMIKWCESLLLYMVETRHEQ